MRSGREQLKRWLSRIFLGAGALALLAPLASWGREAWNQHHMLSRFAADLPVMQAPAGDSDTQAPPAVPARAPDQVPVPEQAPSGTPSPAWVDRTRGIPVYRLEVPSVSLEYMVVEGIDDAPLARGPGHYPGTPLPGEAGNAAIAGHRTVKGRPSFFYRLGEVKAGDLIHITYPDHTVTFAVERVFLTSPYDLSVLAPTPYPALTLTTCDPPGTADRRLIIRAKLVRTP